MRLAGTEGPGSETGLRDYQLDMLNRLRSALKRHRRVVCQSPTGSGKTRLATYMMGRAAQRGIPATFVVHRQELVDQTSAALWQQRLEHGLIVSGVRSSRLPVQVATVQTLVRRLGKTASPGLIIVDEAHRAAAQTYRRILDTYPQAHVVGLTATPERTDGKGLDDLFGDIVEGPSIRWLIEQGYLADYRCYAPSSVDTSGVSSRGGEFVAAEAEKAVNDADIIGDALEHYSRLAKGRRAIAFTVSKNHAHAVTRSFLDGGIPAEMITGETPKQQRAAALNRLRSGETMVLVTVELAIEGLDIPAADVAIMLRPTQSIIVHRQAIGRVLRPNPEGSNAIILDHVGNTIRLGLPDEPREWSLEGRKKANNKGPADEETATPAPKTCPVCFAAHRPAPTCPECGHQYVEQGSIPDEAPGELVEVDPETVRRERMREQGAARTLEDLVAVGMRRGLRSPDGWAAHVFAARQGRKPSKDERAEARRVMQQHRERA